MILDLPVPSARFSATDEDALNNCTKSEAESVFRNQFAGSRRQSADRKYLAVEFYHLTQKLSIKGHLREQLLRASSSIALNLAEGRGKSSIKDQARFFQIAFGSLRECQAILILANLQSTQEWKKLDCLAAHLFNLLRNSGA